MALSLGALFIFLFFFNVSAKVCVRVCGNVRFFNSLENMQDVWGDRSICSSKGLVLCDFFFFFCVRSFNCVQSTEVSWTAMLQKPEMEGDRCGHFSTIPGMRVFASVVDSRGVFTPLLSAGGGFWARRSRFPPSASIICVRRAASPASLAARTWVWCGVKGAGWDP